MFLEDMFDARNLIFRFAFCERQRFGAAVEDRSVFGEFWYLRQLLCICRLSFCNRARRRGGDCSSRRGRNSDGVQCTWPYAGLSQIKMSYKFKKLTSSFFRSLLAANFRNYINVERLLRGRWVLDICDKACFESRQRENRVQIKSLNDVAFYKTLISYLL